MFRVQTQIKKSANFSCPKTPVLQHLAAPLCTSEATSPWHISRALAAQQNGFAGEVCHGTVQLIVKVHGMVDRRVVELNINGGLVFCLVAANDTNRVPFLQIFGRIQGS